MSSPAEVDARIREGLPLARRLAMSRNRRTPANVSYDDLESAALDGLWEAARKFEPERGIQFELWASRIISARLLDFLRQNDPLSRTKRTRAKRVSALKRVLTQSLGRVPTQDELAAATGHAFAELTGLDEEQIAVRSLDSVLIDTILVPPASDDDGSEEFERLTRGLPERSKAILWLYYWEDFSMAAIAAQLGLSESRISQTMADTLGRMRRRPGQ
jgi:RNA polymerase sigma factor for flagellar operon FliA